MGDIEHRVSAGDCMSSIANRYGLTWKQVWNHGPNASLKALRKDPDILLPGDVVMVPEKAERKESKAQEQKHRFVRKAEQPHFSLVLKVDGEPIKNSPCRLMIADHPERKGQVNGIAAK